MTKKFAFVFPGQGSQHLGMLSDFVADYPIVMQLFEQASTILGYDLWRITQAGPLEELNSTEHTQPALLVAGVAIWQIWQQLAGPQPAYFAGHSLGEYTALACAGSLRFNDAVDLVAARGKYMQEAVPAGQGAMAVIIGLDDTQVREVCQVASEEEGEVAPANYNSPGQIVIAGKVLAVERAILLAKEKGAKLTKKLQMSVPSHCRLMQPASLHLKKKLEGVPIKAPTIPVINNVDVTFYKDEQQICDGLVRQLYSPVRWIELVKTLVDKQADTIIESGPGKVLTGLNKRIVAELNLASITDPVSLQEALGLVKQSVPA